VTDPEEIAAIEEALRCYERATGAKLNIEVPRLSGWLLEHNEQSDEYSPQHRNKGIWHPYGEHNGAVGDIQLVSDYQHGANPGP
jgi:hypothetical protein